jgi:CRP-like cAMP-binding protein
MPSHYLASTICQALSALPRSKQLQVSRRKLLPTEGENRSLYLIQTGLVGLERTQNGASILLRILGPGAIVGCEMLFGDPAPLWKAIALQPIKALAIPAEEFLDWYGACPAHQRAILAYLMGERAAMERKVEHLCLSSVRDRILYYLSEVMEIAGEPGSSLLWLSQYDLARYIGATRESTSTILNALAREGLLSLGHRQIVLAQAPERFKVKAAAPAI